MAESKIPKEIKRIVFTGITNSGAGINVQDVTQINSTRFVCIRSTTSDIALIDIGNGFGVAVSNSLQPLPNISVSGYLYYI